MFIDVREPQKIFTLLDRHQIPYERKLLEIGDFVEGDICIERKSIRDFASSVISGHLKNQLARMEESFAKPFLIISGERKSLAFDPMFQMWTSNHHNGALAHLVRYPKLKVLQVDNDTQLVDLVDRIIKKSSDGKVITVADTELLMNGPKNIEDVKLGMLCAIPGIGLEKAKILRNNLNIILLNKDGTNILTKSDIAILEGFGEVTANKVLTPHLLFPFPIEELEVKRKIMQDPDRTILQAPNSLPEAKNGTTEGTSAI